MHLEEVCFKEYERIYREEDSKKKVLNYVIGLINSDYEKFSKVFHKKINETFTFELGSHTKEVEEKGYQIFKKEFFENRLYYEVYGSLNKIESYFNRNFGVIVSEVKDETSEEVQLGWVEYVKNKSLNNFIPNLTKKGKEILEEYENVGRLR